MKKLLFLKLMLSRLVSSKTFQKLRLSCYRFTMNSLKKNYFFLFSNGSKQIKAQIHKSNSPVRISKKLNMRVEMYSNHLRNLQTPLLFTHHYLKMESVLGSIYGFAFTLCTCLLRTNFFHIFNFVHAFGVHISL